MALSASPEHHYGCFEMLSSLLIYQFINPLVKANF